MPALTKLQLIHFLNIMEFLNKNVNFLKIFLAPTPGFCSISPVMKTFPRRIIATVCLAAFAFALVTPADAGRGRPIVIIVPTDPTPPVSAP